ncbi:gamma-glutamyltransferase [Thalassobacillus sp. C254]|uniref:gamma-glutamyltransferase n=1 Tax=Thalassobacillus sp. C254 TaxID=1225341 RepID=UPI0006D01783|nr:gamma-glutamyltransferase [Thalassobacillus sp. C254]
MNSDVLYQPYVSKRNPVFAKKGMVATSHPLAAEAGKEMLMKGGNAVDAAIATAAALTVVEPTSNSMGGDSFALVWIDGRLHGLNASGKSPRKMSMEAVKEAGYKEIPEHGLIPVTVPGAPGSWAELSEKFGRLPFKDVLAPAISLAEEGFPVSPVVSKYWKRSYELFKEVLTGEEFSNWFDTFSLSGRCPEAGEIWKAPDHAETLRKIGDSNGDAFYKGELADQIDSYSRNHGGLIRKEDLEDFTPEWVEPISTSYKGFDIWEIPPNGQGLNTLLALNILEDMNLSEKETVDTYHLLIEAMKLGFADGLHYITDPHEMSVRVKDLLSEEYAKERRKKISDKAMTPEAGEPPKGGTVYIAAADNEGNMVSFIQSSYMDFGSGVVVPGTGINLQNRGHGFSLNKGHVNALSPRKKTYHTIIPGFLTKENQPVGPFGVMGAFMQPQGHLQVLTSTINFHLNPQAALDAPRWRWLEEKTIEVEPHFPDHIAQSLERKGHQIKKAVDETGFGRGQVIWRDPATGVLTGGTDSRADGHIAVW